MSAPVRPDRGSRSGAILTFVAGSIAVSALLWQAMGAVDAAPAPSTAPAPAPALARPSQSAAARPAAPRAPRPTPRPTLRTRGS